MNILKKLIIVILILLVLGLYYIPDKTKEVIDSTGHVTKEAAKGVYDKIKEKNITQDIKDKVEGEFNEQKT